MTQVVAIHNSVNERAWQHVLAWEALHACECAQPRLARFRGRPNEYSPKARLLNFLVRCRCCCGCIATCCRSVLQSLLHCTSPVNAATADTNRIATRPRRASSCRLTGTTGWLTAAAARCAT